MKYLSHYASHMLNSGPEVLKGTVVNVGFSNLLGHNMLHQPLHLTGTFLSYPMLVLILSATQPGTHGLYQVYINRINKLESQKLKQGDFYDLGLFNAVNRVAMGGGIPKSRVHFPLLHESRKMQL